MPLSGSPQPPRPAESSMHIRSPLPAGASSRSLLEFFSRALASFKSSGSKFQVICTVAPPTSNGPLPQPVPPRTKPPTLIVLDSSFNPPSRAHLRMATSAIYDRVDLKGSGQATRASRLLLLLAINNADKAPKPAAFEQRLAMMWAFAGDIHNALLSEKQGAEASDGLAKGEEQERLSIDIALSTQPFFHEKCAAIAESAFYEVNGAGEMEQTVLAGYDTLVRILNPKYYGPPAEAGQVSGGAVKTPMQKMLDPFFARAKLRVTMRTDDGWGSKDVQLSYLEDLLNVDGLSRIGGSVGWASRIQLVEGRKDGEDIVSSTYARVAAKERDWSMLDKMVTPGVRWWVEEERLYTE